MTVGPLGAFGVFLAGLPRFFTGFCVFSILQGVLEQALLVMVITSIESLTNFKIKGSITIMEKYPDFEQVLVDKIHYHCIDVPCCLTCAHGKKFDDDMVLCRGNKYYNPEIGEIINWYGDHLGLCDNYKK